MSYILERLVLPSKKCNYDYCLPYLLFIPRSDCHFVPAIYYVLNTLLPTVLVAHGNATNLKDYDIETMANTWNANIIIYDYSYYGLHTCKEPSEEHCHMDAIAVYDYLVNKGVTNIILYGYSIGTGVTCNLAYYLGKKGIYPRTILVAAFKSIWNALLFASLPCDIFKTHVIAPCLKNEVLFLHGCDDNICNYKAAIELAKTFPNVYKFHTIHGCDHSRIIHLPEHDEEVKKFVTYDNY
jgi:pimeloyl-ACP methyl ester carboxylesterase